MQTMMAALADPEHQQIAQEFAAAQGLAVPQGLPPATAAGAHQGGSGAWRCQN